VTESRCVDIMEVTLPTLVAAAGTTLGRPPIMDAAANTTAIS
jgi:hypothetical protein